MVFKPERKHGVLALLAAPVLALTACVTPTDTTPEGPVDLTMTVWATNELQLALFDEIAAEYLELNPELVKSITFESTPSDTYTDALRTRIAGGDVPDLAWVVEATALEFVKSGALLDLKPTLTATPGYDLPDVMESSLALWEDGDGLYAFPFSNSPFATFVNKDLLAQAGQPDPASLVESGEWTWDAALAIAEAVAATTGQDGLVIRDFEYRDWKRLAEVWSGWGASAWSEDGKTCEFADPEMVEAMTWLHDAIFVKDALPQPGTTADFFAGEAGLTLTQISRASAIDESFAWDVVPLPAGPAGQVSVIGQAGVGVLANGAHPEIAVDFLAFFTNPENSAKLGQFFPSPRKSGLTPEILANSNPLLSPEQLESVVVEAVDGAVTLPSHVRAGELLERVRSELDALWVASADVETVLGQVCATIQPILED